jgi:hypothetical protein
MGRGAVSNFRGSVRRPIKRRLSGLPHLARGIIAFYDRSVRLAPLIAQANAFRTDRFAHFLDIALCIRWNEARMIR